MSRVRALVRAPAAFVDTYGCQQNEADSELIRGMLNEMGYGFTEYEAEADLIVINTCAVREHAEQRVLGNIGHLVHSRKPGQKIAVCGCAVQQEHMREQLLKSYRHVDLIFGPHELWRFPELLEKTLTAEKKVKITETRDIDGERVEGLPVLRKSGEKAWLSIMYGCNNFCSYCVVPYVRGRERSRDFDSIIREAREIIASGFTEITLLGQNVNSYGRDLYGNAEFPKLLRAIAELPGEFTLHFRTSHPKDAGEELFRVIADCGKVANFLHLPFQSGNNRVLDAMKRGYSAEEYLAKIARLKELVPGVELSSDVIVGFPGETDAEFEDTLSLVEQVRFRKLFTFIYSPRRGTPASNLPDPFSRAEKLARFDKLIALQKSIESEGF
jgi:tRNA-2-methylthio-N6-dimethylallyladenosine synthase